MLAHLHGLKGSIKDLLINKWCWLLFTISIIYIYTISQNSVSDFVHLFKKNKFLKTLWVYYDIDSSLKNTILEVKPLNTVLNANVGHFVNSFVIMMQVARRCRNALTCVKMKAQKTVYNPTISRTPCIY